jgi:hypothetical protein
MIMGKAKRLLRPANLVDEVPDDGVKPDLTKFLGSQIRSLRRAREITLDGAGLGKSRWTRCPNGPACRPAT